MCFQITLKDVWLSLWTKIFLEEQPPAGHIFPLSFSFSAFSLPPRVSEKSIRCWQNCLATLSHLLSPLIFFIVHGSHTLQPPSAPSQSIIPRQSTGHCPLTPPCGSPPICYWQDEFDLQLLEQTSQSAFYGTSHSKGRESIATSHGFREKKTLAASFEYFPCNSSSVT